MTTRKTLHTILLALLFLIAAACKDSDVAVNPDTTTNKNPDPKVSPFQPTTEQVANGIFHTKGTSLTSLDVIPSGNLPDNASKVLVATLQGLVAKSSGEQIYIDEGGAGSAWKNYMSTKYGIPLNTSYTTWQSLVTHFSAKVSGYILYNMASNQKSLSAATSLCGPMNAIAVDATLESAVRTLGITNKILDVSTRDEKWVYTNYKSSLSTRAATELSPSVYYHQRDYSTMINALTFYDGVTTWRQGVLQGLTPEAFLYGYGSDEFNMIAQSSTEGVASLPSDMAPNLSAHSSIYSTAGLTQSTYTNPTTENNVHYVTFLTSDGDNIAYNLWSQYDYFNNANRGTFNMGYTISPSLVDLAPATLRWFYEKASNGTYKDHFVAGPSGSGYIFPSKMSSGDLDTYLNRLDTFMGAANLKLCNILDQNAYGRTDLWNKYLGKTNIDGLLYTGYGETPQGRISFSSNGKPIIEARDNLWAGLEEESTVISNINSRPANPSTAAGYTLVFVHVWTKSLSNIKTVINGLNANVRVVTPDAFVKLVKANLGGVSQNPIANGTYKVINYNSAKALDVAGASTADGGNVLQWSYGGANNQRWTFTYQNNGYYKITSLNSGKALDVAGFSTADGGNVDQWTWNSGDNQLWQVSSNGDGTYKLTNKYSGKVLEVFGASAADGANVDQWTWGNGTNQKWLIQTP
jgi:hypothetical protein